MKGQSSAETLILVSVILISVTALFYLGQSSNETATILRAARDGAENAIFTIDMDNGCTIDIENLTFSSSGTITINVVARNAPPDNISWDNFAENTIENNIRTGALKYIHYALAGSFPTTVASVKTSYYTYDVEVEARRVTQ